MPSSIDFFYFFISFTLCFLLTTLSAPSIIQKLKLAGLIGIDVNKLDKPEVPTIGGLSSVLGFALGISISLGIIKILDQINEIPILIILCVLSISVLIGFLDDISFLSRREKAFLISFSAFPLMISQVGEESIDFFIFKIFFEGYNYYLFWLILVPIGVSGCANAINMLAGYNGLETGQLVIISFFLSIIGILEDVAIIYIIVFISVCGSNLALFRFNKYPAKTFVGDVGTLGFGSVIGAAVIMSNISIFGVLCILPTFYELFATIKYSLLGIDRRNLCMSPIIQAKNLISPPKGAEDYTLAYFILSKKPMTEIELTRTLLSLYIISGILATTISIFN